MGTADGKVVLCNKTLKLHRKRLCLSQEGLAFCSSEKNSLVSLATIKRAESGRQVNYNTARKLARVFGVDAIDLIDKSTLSPKGSSLPEDPSFPFSPDEASSTYIPLSVGEPSLIHTQQVSSFAAKQLATILNNSITSNLSHLVWVRGENYETRASVLKQLHSLAIKKGCDSHFFPVNTLGIKNTINILQGLAQEYNCYANKNRSNSRSTPANKRRPPHKQDSPAQEKILAIFLNNIKNINTVLKNLSGPGNLLNQHTTLYVLASGLTGPALADKNMVELSFPVTSIFLP